MTQQQDNYVEYTWHNGEVTMILASQIDTVAEKDKILKEVSALTQELDHHLQQKYRLELILQNKQKQIANLNRKIKV